MKTVYKQSKGRHENVSRTSSIRNVGGFWIMIWKMIMETSRSRQNWLKSLAVKERKRSKTRFRRLSDVFYQSIYAVKILFLSLCVVIGHRPTSIRWIFENRNMNEWTVAGWPSYWERERLETIHLRQSQTGDGQLCTDFYQNWTGVLRKTRQLLLASASNFCASGS